MNGYLNEKIAIVTGGAQGLGRAITKRLAREGCDVVVADIKDDALQDAVEVIASETGRHIVGLRTDVTREADVETLFDRTQREFGRIDIVVSNAAILIAEPIIEADAAKWHAVMEVSMFGYFLVTKHACRIMKRQQCGSIININSKSGKRGSAANSAYAASKFGSIGHTQSVALEMAPFNVRCNAVCPGNLLDSPLWNEGPNALFKQYARNQGISEEAVRQKYIDQVPMKRGCTYDDVCNIVAFLASDQASYMTGQAINVTGGQVMH